MFKMFCEVLKDFTTFSVKTFSSKKYEKLSTGYQPSISVIVNIDLHPQFYSQICCMPPLVATLPH